MSVFVHFVGLSIWLQKKKKLLRKSFILTVSFLQYQVKKPWKKVCKTGYGVPLRDFAYWFMSPELISEFASKKKFKGYLGYKTNLCHKVVLNVWLINLLIWIFCSRDIEIFVFYETHRFQNLWRHHKYCSIMQVTLMLIYFEP